MNEIVPAHDPTKSVTRLWDKDFNLLATYEGLPTELLDEATVTVDNSDGTRKAARFHSVKLIWA